MDCELGVLAAAVNYGILELQMECVRRTSSQSSAFAFNHNINSHRGKGIPLLSSKLCAKQTQ